MVKDSPNEDGKYVYDFARPSVTVDIVIFKYDESMNEYLLAIERGHPPYKGQYALPGGFVNMDERIISAAVRELKEETGIEIPASELKLFKVYDDPNRDPRGRVISHGYVGILRNTKIPVAGDDAAKAMWLKSDELPLMAFDHTSIIGHAKDYISRKIVNY